MTPRGDTHPIGPGSVVLATGARRLLLGIALSVLAAGTAVALLAVAGWFIAASALAGLVATASFSWVIASAGVRALAVGRTLARYGERVSTHAATLQAVARLRTTLFTHALRLDAERASQLGSGDLLGRLLADTDAVDLLILRVAVPTITVACVTPAAVGFVALFSGQAASILAFGTLAVAVGGGMLAGRWTATPAVHIVEQRADARAAVIEALEGLPELQSFGAEAAARQTLLNRLKSLGEAQHRLAMGESAAVSAAGLAGEVTLAAVLLVSAGALGGPALSAPTLVMLALTAVAVVETAGGLLPGPAAYRRARLAAARLDELLTVPSGRGHQLPLRPGRPFTGSLRAEGVAFADADGSRLHGSVDLDLPAGDSAVVVGASGTGKSTLLSILAGELAPTCGTMSLDGVELSALPQAARVDQVCLVGQSVHLFDGTLEDNLRLASADASEAELIAALHAAVLDELLESLPLGLATPLGAHGHALSGGQRRRLTIAQGLLRKPRVLLLDEPTEGLDAPTAEELLRRVRAALPQTALAITLHDRSGVRLPWLPDQRIRLPCQRP